MKIAIRDSLTVHQLYEKSNLTLSVEPKYHDVLHDIAKTMHPGIEYDIEIKEVKPSRSLNANAYAWVLIGKLAEAIGIPPIEVYKLQVKDMYTYRDVLVKDEEFESSRREWIKDHKGRELEKLGPCKTQKGWTWCRQYRSSSDYDTKEMSRFIDLIVFECQQQGIETKTPQEIAALKQKWHNN